MKFKSKWKFSPCGVTILSVHLVLPACCGHCYVCVYIWSAGGGGKRKRGGGAKSATVKHEEVDDDESSAESEADLPDLDESDTGNEEEEDEKVCSDHKPIYSLADGLNQEATF